jgi:hypothetical protein
MASLRAKVAILSAGMTLATALLFAGCAEEASQEPEPPAATPSMTPAATNSATQADEPIVRSKSKGVAEREVRLQKRRNWWNHAREVLFADIVLTDEQSQAVDAVIDEQLRKQAVVLKHDAEFNSARRSRKDELIDAARIQLRESRAQLKKTQEIYAELSALLTKEQLPQFNMNRAHHVAESQALPAVREQQTE